MTDPLTGRAIAKALRASLSLTSGSSKLLSLSQLYAVKDDLRGTLTLVEGEICAAESRAAESGKHVWWERSQTLGDSPRLYRQKNATRFGSI